MSQGIKTLLSLFRPLFFPVLLICIVSILFYANYIPGTWLSGWDNLHPELNWGVYLKRSIFSAWQENYGLGAVAVQSYAADLPRLLVYYPLSLFLQLSDVRWAYFFLTLLFGTLGSYFFLEQIKLRDGMGRLEHKVIAFLGALVYLFNLGTLQIFVLPFEMNITHFATLPWLFLWATKFLESGKKSMLLLFALASLMATPIAHTATLFMVYFAALSVYVGFLGLFNLRSNLKRGVLILLTCLVVNSFWLVPTAYSIIKQGQMVAKSKINEQFSYNVAQTEKKVGTIQNTAILKNVFFDWGKYSNQESKFVPLLADWQKHLGNPLVLLIGYGVFLVASGGILFSFLGKNRYGIALAPIFVVSFFFLANDAPVVRQVLPILENGLPLVKEALRFTLTKFTIVTIFPLSVYFAIALATLSGLLKFKSERLWKIIGPVVVAVLFTALIYYFAPGFKGGLVDSKMRVSIPQEYFLMTSWLNSQGDTGRIAEFPVSSFWAWQYYKWGYEGMGFWWFGLNAPVMDREFDRWSQYNENYYWETSRAVYSKDVNHLMSIFEKYQIRWLVLDENVISPMSPMSLYTDEIKEMLARSNNVDLAKKFGSISVYSVKTKNISKDYVFVAQNLPSVGPKYAWSDQDVAFEEFGHYQNTETPQINYQYRSLFTRDVVGRAGIPEFVSDNSFEVDLAEAENRQKAINCKESGSGFVENQEIVEGWRLIAQDATNCSAVYPLPQLSQREGYVIEIESRNVAGNSLLFWVEDLLSRRVLNESFLNTDEVFNKSYFIIPPMDRYGLGYTLHLDDVSIGSDRAVNDLKTVKVYQFPYDSLSRVKHILGEVFLPVFLDKDNFSVTRLNPVLYRIDLASKLGSNNGTVVLQQAFNDGWIAFGIDDSQKVRSLTGHALVDNWANGWKLSGNERIVYLFFWPQLLEFAGLGLLGIFAVFLLTGYLRKFTI